MISHPFVDDCPRVHISVHMVSSGDTVSETKSLWRRKWGYMKAKVTHIEGAFRDEALEQEYKRRSKSEIWSWVLTITKILSANATTWKIVTFPQTSREGFTAAAADLFTEFVGIVLIWGPWGDERKMNGLIWFFRLWVTFQVVLYHFSDEGLFILDMVAVCFAVPFGSMLSGFFEVIVIFGVFVLSRIIALTKKTFMDIRTGKVLWEQQGLTAGIIMDRYVSAVAALSLTYVVSMWMHQTQVQQRRETFLRERGVRKRKYRKSGIPGVADAGSVSNSVESFGSRSPLSGSSRVSGGTGSRSRSKSKERSRERTRERSKSKERARSRR